MMTARDLPLTDISAILYLLSNGDGNGEGMKGSVRAKGRCPECSSEFRYNQKLGYLCPSCKITPKRFYIDLFYKGKRIRIFSDKHGQALDTYQRAKNLLEVINYEINNFCFDPSKYVKAELEKFWINNLLDRFLQYKIDGIAPSYQKDYRRMLGFARDFFKNKDIRDLRKLDVVNYKERLEKKVGYKGKTLKNTLDLFKTFLNYCKSDLEVIGIIPLFPSVDVPEPNFKWLSQDDQIKLFELVQDDDKPIIAFLMLHGCRPGEARALKCKDIDLTMQRITVSATFSGRIYMSRRKGKKSKPVMIPIHPELSDYIAGRVKNNLPEAFLFMKRDGSHYTENKLRRLWNRVREQAGISKTLRLYDATRHSFASQLVNSGTSIFKVSKLLGHSSVKITEKYTHQNIENLKSDMSKLSLKKNTTVTRLSPETLSLKK